MKDCIMVDKDFQIDLQERELFEELVFFIEKSKHQALGFVNSTLTLLFWQLGQRINNHILQHKRGVYGKQIVVTLSRQLKERYGRNYEEKNLRRMIQFAALFTDYEKVVTLSRHLSWSHFLVLIPIKNDEAVYYYAQKIVAENWSVRTLRKQVSIKTFERTAVANTQLPQIIAESYDLFKDPYLLDFLQISNGFLENDLEKAILNDIEKFIMELGRGFAFIERQKRIIVDGDDFYIDLLFYHRQLKRLVAIELKIDKFKAKYKGQMELYLKWLDKHEKQDGENAPIGLILCTEASKEQIELLEMHKDGIMVAEYLTQLPPKKQLEEKIRQSLHEAKERIAKQKLLS